MRLSSFTLCLLFKPNMCTNTSNKDQSNTAYLSSQPLNIIDIDSISIPNDFMNPADKSIINELLDSSIESNDHGNNNLGLELGSGLEKLSLKYLITYIKHYNQKHFSSQDGKYPQTIYKVKNLIINMYKKLSEIDFAKQNDTASNISDKKLKLSLIKLLKLLKHTVESDIFKNSIDFSERAKKLRANLMNDLSKESIACYDSFSEFTTGSDKVDHFKTSNKQYSVNNETTIDQESQTPTTHNNTSKNTISSILSAKKSSLDNQTASNHADQVPKENNKFSKNANILQPSNTSDIRIFGLMSANKLFTCKNPFENEKENNDKNKIARSITKSFCKSNDGIWYFALECSNYSQFCILKINQENFGENVSTYEINRSYSTVSNDGVNEVPFNKICRRIHVNSAGILYVLKYSTHYSSYEILALDSNFHLIKKLEPSCFEKYGFEDSFIEDFEIYDNSLFMFDSVKKCIVVTDFEFNVKRIVDIDIKFEKFGNRYKNRTKNKLSLLVTEKYLYFYFNGEMCACENNALNSKNHGIIIYGDALKITVENNNNYLNCFEDIAYVGDNRFISLPSRPCEHLIFTELVSNAAPLTSVSGILLLNYKLPKKSFSLGRASKEDHTVYLLEGGENIKLFELVNNGSNLNNQ